MVISGHFSCGHNYVWYPTKERERCCQQRRGILDSEDLGMPEDPENISKGKNHETAGESDTHDDDKDKNEEDEEEARANMKPSPSPSPKMGVTWRVLRMRDQRTGTLTTRLKMRPFKTMKAMAHCTVSVAQN